ncbi:MAG: ribokinase [Saprospiraceae bacterium]
MPTILVIGSSNTDMVVRTARFPQPGETILGGEFFMFPGGKGVNQAVAAARLGGEVTFVCKLGQDVFGRQAMEGFIKEKINTTYCYTSPDTASGVALITVNAAGENEIVVASGANNELTKEDLEEAHAAFEQADIILIQLETPILTVEHAIRKGYEMGKRVILNPAPAQAFSADIYPCLYLITPNETEAALLTGIEVTDAATANQAADALLQFGAQQVLVTLGSRGAFFKSSETQALIPAKKVKAVDTTAAGDVFNGALAVALAKGCDWLEAIDFAASAAAVAVTRMGAQTSAPTRIELYAFASSFKDRPPVKP